MERKIPNFTFENKLWKKGINIVAGLDEVGRGAFAGPVVTGCVIFHKNIKIDILIDDSKKISPKKREIAEQWIKKNAIACGIGEASVAEINKHGIVKATNIAFRRAIIRSQIKIDFLLIDAFYIPYVKDLSKKNQLPIIKGDAKSYSIAAASIIAKVHRDNLMTKLSQKNKYKKYNWDRNKGYGTLDHRKTIEKFGITKEHRKKFVD